MKPAANSVLVVSRSLRSQTKRLQRRSPPLFPRPCSCNALEWMVNTEWAVLLFFFSEVESDVKENGLEGLHSGTGEKKGRAITSI